MLGDLRGMVVADPRVQRGDQHQRMVHQLVDPLPVRLDSFRAIVVEAHAGVSQEPGAPEEVVDDQWLEYVQLEVAHRAAKVHRHVIPQHLTGDHRQCLRLRGVDLPRHDRAPGLVFRDGDLAQPASRTRREPANVVGDFHQRCRQRLERSVSMHQGVMRCEGLELVRSRDERVPGHLGQLGRDAGSELGVGVEPGSDSGAADRQLEQVRQRGLEVRKPVVKLRDVA